jgi:signal transduction histidine kinase
MKPTKYITWFYAQNLSIRYTMILSMIIIIAYIDYITPAEFSIRLFYMVPLFLSVWDGRGIIPGLFFSIICTLVFFYGESLQGNIHWHGFSLIWEFIVVWSYNIAFVIIVDKLKKFTLALSKLNEELEKVNNQKDKFFSIIAHDLRSPFTGFLGLTKNMVEEADSYSSEELAQASRVMYNAADNLFKLLQNLLEWAMMQSGSTSIVRIDILLSEMIATNVETIKVRSELKGISINNMAVDQIHAYADEKMVNSVLLNLLSNAVKFTPRNGAITVSAKEIEDKMIEISVRDTGIGMPKSIVEKLFILDKKIGRKGTDGELSTGLGLLLCKEFVEKNGGKIWVESEEGVGSTFYFTLPEKDGTSPMIKEIAT